MSKVLLILAIILSIITINAGRSLRSPDSFEPSLLSAINPNHIDVTSYSSNSGQHPILYIIEHIIKYITKIESDEHFIDDILNRQKHIVDKIKIMRFLENCFQIINTLIQREINRLVNPSEINQKSLFILPFTLEELQKAQTKLNNLFQIIDERMSILNSYFPPTMPFLNF